MEFQLNHIKHNTIFDALFDILHDALFDTLLYALFDALLVGLSSSLAFHLDACEMTINST